MRVNTIQNTYAWVTQLKWFQDKLALSKAIMDEHQANMTWYIFVRLIGGQNRYRKVMSSCFSKASIEPDRPPDDGTFTSRNGWSGTDTLPLTVKRLFHEAQGF